jgi:hypothetical protein
MSVILYNITILIKGLLLGNNPIPPFFVIPAKAGIKILPHPLVLRLNPSPDPLPLLKEGGIFIERGFAPLRRLLLIRVEASPFRKEPALVPLSHHEVSLPKGR